jgi:hypothetical protein
MDNYTIEYIDVVPITVNEGTQSFVFEEIQVFNIVPTETLVVNSSTSALNSFIQIALRDIGGLRVLLTDQSYADQSDINSYGKVIGLSKGAVVTGSMLEIVTASELNGFTALIPNTQVYLGLNGIITQTVPTTGFIQQLGVALTPTSILVNISLPLLLS